MKSKLAEIDQKSVTYGRPRLLTHEEILEGAVKLGLEGLTMKKLATFLKVGTATLYQYFDSRKTLMRAAAVYALSDVELPKDEGQHWSTYAREFALSLQTILAENPSYIHSQQHSDFGFEVQFKLIEEFLGVLNKRGFSPKQGMDLFNMVGLAAFAGATEAVRQREFEYEDESMAIVAKRQFARLDVKDFPLLKQALPKFIYTPEQKVETLLLAAFKTIARERDETITDLFKPTN